ncbi:WG repeat-containing protein [Phocoenobacter skyensis]|uniref:WG repeat-containing protein n=1 Tax=Phocoenobacter skyensis TaxID=97481 RepID=A0ABT9JJD5_9PAST|nr:WG repeat-containing protein [Pasteurella skyensis]MDP8078951.1 WG repeat-containing protein [Pasteurella skyensis]MDP8084901.1 WG repeat-containing protein [Pasteurella skyensis]
MKRSLLSFLILVSSYTNAQSVDNLNIQESSGRPVYVTGYDLNNKYITLNFKVTDSMNVCWYGSGENIPFIIDDNSKKSSLVGLDNVTYCPERMSMSSGDKFFVKFVAPSDNAKTFSLVEGECALNYKEGCWRFENIPLNHQSKKSEYSVTQKDFYYIANNKLTEADLKDYSKGQLRLLRNYFFAKKGFTFKEGSDLDTFFKTFSWYSPKEITSTDIYENQLTEQEKNNVSLILAMEKGESVEQVVENKEQPKSSETNTVKEVVKVEVDLKPIEKNGKYGFVNSKGNIVIPLEYDEAYSFSENGLAAIEKNGKWGFINSKGKIVIPLQYDGAYFFAKNGLAPVIKDGKYGFINSKGNIVIPLQYDKAYSFSENGLAAIKKERKWGFINDKAEVIIPLQYDNAHSFSENGLAAIKKERKWGFINNKAKVIIPLQYKQAFRFSKYGLAPVSKSIEGLTVWGVINSQGDVITPFKYTFIYPFSKNGFAKVERNRKRGFLNRKGEFFYGSIPSSDKNTLSVVHNEQGKYGLVDNKGSILIPLEYDEITKEYSSVLKLRKNEEYKYMINNKNNLIIYDFVGSFHEGLAYVKKDEKWGFIDEKGNIVIPFEYEFARVYGSELLVVKKDGKLFYINKKGECVKYCN